MSGACVSYLSLVRKLRCCACGSGLLVEAHHSTVGRAFGRKSDDHNAMPLCRVCHGDFHAGRGRFHNWSRDRRRLWQIDMVADTRRAIAEA